MDGLHKASEELLALEEEVPYRISLIEDIEHLLARYPDLMVYRPDRESPNLICCSATANNYVDTYEYTEVTLESGIKTTYIWPYTVVDCLRIYSCPPCYMLATENTKGFGVVPEDKWDDKLLDDKISNNIIKKIRFYLKGKPPINYTE